MPVVGGHFPTHGGTIFFRLSVEVLVPASPPDFLHREHPETVGVGADRVHGLLEADLDFEPEAVDPQDVEWIEREVGGHQQDLPANGVVNRDDANERAGGFPEEVHVAIGNRHVAVPVDGAVCVVGVVGRLKEFA